MRVLQNLRKVCLVVDLDEFGNPIKNNSFPKKTHSIEQIFDALVLGREIMG